jgi:hypothetical protein
VPAEYKKEIELRFEKLLALSSSSNKDCLDLVLEEAAELEKDIDAAGKNKDKFAGNQTEIENLKGRLNDKALRKHMPEKVKELEKELKSIKAKIKTKKPLDAAEVLKTFADKVGEAEGQCGEIATYRYKFDERLPDARAGLEKLSEALKSASGGKLKKYQGTFVKKLAEAEELQARETSSDVEKAITSLDAIIKQMGELAAASETAGQEGNLSPLVTEENNRLAIENELKVELKKWETEYKNFKEGPCKLAEAAVKGAKGRGDNKQLQFIIDLGEKAHDFGKDAKDIATLNTAREQLEAAIRNAEDLAETPEGGTTISKKKIAKLKVEWRDRVKAFKASLKSIEDAVIERSAGDPAITDSQKTALAGHFKKISEHYFSPIDFDKPINVLSANPPNPIGQQRKAREQGLRVVRSHRKRLLKDPFISHLARNPFSQTLDRKKLFQVLKNLDLNLQRCVEEK